MVEITLRVAQTVNTEQLQNCGYRIYRVCLWYVTVHTVREGEDRDDDGDDNDDDDDNDDNNNNKLQPT